MLLSAFGPCWAGDRASLARFRGFTAFSPHRVDYHEYVTDFLPSVPAVAMTTAATVAPTATLTDKAVVMEVVTAAAATVVAALVVTACPTLARA